MSGLTSAHSQDLPRLSAAHRTGPKAPVRIVHLGLGAFHRSHQAWYTQHASDADAWGIASVTGRRPDAAQVLAEQDGLYTLISRGPDKDAFELVSSIVEALDGAETAQVASLIAAPGTAVVTLTITEAGYHLRADGTLDTEAPEVAADIHTLVHDGVAARPLTALGRLVLGLRERAETGSGPLAIVCCDNLASNGKVLKAALLGLADATDQALGRWVRKNISFVSTSIDRITPRATEADAADVAQACHYLDKAPVVAEPFADWVLSGEFPAGRPDWESAGARFVEEIEPFENRKLWLLNGAHSLLAYAGHNAGHQTVAEALADPACAEAVEAFWDEAAAHLTEPGLEIPAYRQALRERFENPRIAHFLAQIAMDGTAKLRLRALPILAAERAAGRSGAAAATALAAWLDYLDTMDPGNLRDPQAEAILKILKSHGSRGSDARPAGPSGLDASGAEELLALISPDLAQDQHVLDLIQSRRGIFTATPTF